MSPQALYVILGFPVAHSKSPAMHNAAFAALQIPAMYAPCAVHPDALRDAIAGIRALGIAGANVTLPHKSAVMQWLDDATPQARAIGAVNTLYWDNQRLIGHNTDAPGLAQSLITGSATLQGTRITLLGAGGAARATIVGLADAGAAHITVVARRHEAATQTVSELAPSLTHHTCTLEALPWERLADLFKRTDLLVQGTSATLAGQPQAADFAAALPLEQLPDHALVTDLVYKPLLTTVLARAQARGLRTIDGLGMLLHQGALAFERWTGQVAPLDVMREALL